MDNTQEPLFTNKCYLNVLTTMMDLGYPTTLFGGSDNILRTKQICVRSLETIDNAIIALLQQILNDGSLPLDVAFFRLLMIIHSVLTIESLFCGIFDIFLLFRRGFMHWFPWPMYT
eukprot:284748_1